MIVMAVMAVMALLQTLVKTSTFSHHDLVSRHRADGEHLHSGATAAGEDVGRGACGGQALGGEIAVTLGDENPLVNSLNYGKSWEILILIGESTINGPCSAATLVFWRVLSCRQFHWGHFRINQVFLWGIRYGSTVVGYLLGFEHKTWLKDH